MDPPRLHPRNSNSSAKRGARTPEGFLSVNQSVLARSHRRPPETHRFKVGSLDVGIGFAGEAGEQFFDE
jgi:hypothetical protein